MTSKLFAIAALALVGASAQTLTGTVKDDSGVVISNTSVTSGTGVNVHVDIRQTNTFTQDQSGRVRPSPGFSASTTHDATGAFSVANVPPGTYWVCAYTSSPGYLSNCDWSVPPHAVIVSAATTAAVPLTLIKGMIVTLDVNDPSGKIDTAALNSGHHFYPGVMSATGAYSAARPSSKNGTHHFYVVTIPRAADLNLFVDSDLTVLDANGNKVATRTPSTVVVSGQGGPVTLSLSVE